MSARTFVLLGVFLIFCFIRSSTGEISSNILHSSNHLHKLSDRNKYSYEIPNNSADKVNVQLYYECLCGDCRNFDTNQFKKVVEVLNEFLTIQTYPYGNAETIEHNGKYTFKCQHGPAECYGNKLHACALDIIRNQTQALLFNSCMMDWRQTNRGSDDVAVDKCGSTMNIDTDPIKTCAKGEKGIQLLKHYGDESKRANFRYVPYILVNGKESDGSSFMKDVCAAYANPPPPCANLL